MSKRSALNPLDRVLQYAADAAAADVRLYHDMGDYDSPIERLMAAALYAQAKHGFGEHHSFARFCWRDQSDIESGDAPGDELLHIVVQAPVLTFRVDFLIVAKGWQEERKIVVECDGHDFHERTKEQAERDRSRDRKMTEAGYTVLRFTGREIYRDPIKCAEQVLRLADKAVFG